MALSYIVSTTIPYEAPYGVKGFTSGTKAHLEACKASQKEHWRDEETIVDIYDEGTHVMRLHYVCGGTTFWEPVRSAWDPLGD